MLSIIEPIPLVAVTGKMLLIIIVSVVFNLHIGIEASCEIPLSPEHGTLHLLGDSKVDSLALYSCEYGWKLVGASASKCRITGQWTSPPPKCVAEKRSSSRTTATAIVPTATTVGADLPERKATSVENEEQDPPKPSKQTTHENNCSCTYNSHDRKLSAEVNGLGLWNGDKVRKGDKLTLRCYDPAKHLVLPNATSISGILALTCDVCRTWEDSDLPSCEDVGSEPCSIPFVQNGKIRKWVLQSFGRGQKYQEIPVGQRIEDGDKFFLHCDNGYRPLGISIKTNWQAMMVCRGGKWSDDPFCELSICEAEPPEVENGRVEKMDRKHGGTVSYECLPNFSKVKTGNVNCNMGEWKGMASTCKDVRCHAESVRHKTGVAEISNVTLHGDVLQVRCKEGYEPRPNLPLCSNGEWRSNQESPCKEKDCMVPWISNGEIKEQIVGPSEYNWWKVRWERKVTYRTVGVGSVPSRDATLFLVCDNRYSIQGTRPSPGNITCSEGRWSPDPVCLRTGTQYTKTTEAPRSVNINRVTENSLTTARTTTMSDASRFVSGTIGSKSTTTTGTPVVSKLPDEADHEEIYVPPDSECFCEYVPDGNFVAHADGKEVKMNDKVKNGTVLKLRCEKVGYHRLFGPTEVLCDKCRPWSSSDFPSCVNPQRGDTIIVYSTVNVSLDGVLEPRNGQSLRMSCAAMETNGFPEWHVPNVTGIDLIEERRERTGDILYLSHLDIKNISSKYNGYYSCAFDKENPTIVQLRVVDIMCRDLKGSDLMTISYTDNRRVGSFANFHCFAPGILSGVRLTQCLENGEWKDSSPICSTPPCSSASLSQVIPHIVVYDKDDVTSSTMSYNSTVKLMCRGDKNLVGNSFARCGSEGIWKVGNITCISGCPPFVNAAGSRLFIKPEKDAYRIGEIVTFSCGPGYKLNTDLEVVMCLQSGWSEGALPECIKWYDSD